MSQQQHSPTTSTSRTRTFKQVLRRMLWVLFCTTTKDDLHFDCVEQRWRLLLWALLVSTLWNTTGHNWGIFAPILLLLSFIKVSVVCARRSPGQLSTWQFPACLALLCFITVLTSSSSYFTFTHLMQKLAVKEYSLWCHWCPDTHVTIASVIVITCTVQGIPNRSTLSALMNLSNFKKMWTPPPSHLAPKATRFKVLHKGKGDKKMFTEYDDFNMPREAF